MTAFQFSAVVLGGSAGALQPMLAILSRLPGDYPLPLLLVQHVHKTDAGSLARHLDAELALPVAEACDKEPVEPPHLYVAPADYHLLVERECTLALSVDHRVAWSRPSIDVLFDSASRAWGERLIGVLLSGANDDGARGMKTIRAAGGFCVAQDPETAESPEMPLAAIELAGIETVLPPTQIGALLMALACDGGERDSTRHRKELG